MVVRAVRTDHSSGTLTTEEVLSLLQGSPERIDVLPIGGAGYLAGGAGATIVNLQEVEDQAPKFGMGDVLEARFAARDLDAAARPPPPATTHRLPPPQTARSPGGQPTLRLDVTKAVS